MPACFPSALIACTVRCTCGPASGWTVMMSAPASANDSSHISTGLTIRWTSNGLVVCGRSALTTPGPMVRLGTKCPSITSTWIQSAPASSIARTSSPSRAKSAERIDGAMRTGACTDTSPSGSAHAFEARGRLYPQSLAFEARDEEAVERAFVGEHGWEGADIAARVRRDALRQFVRCDRIERKLWRMIEM